jgi:hypothetical protein
MLDIYIYKIYKKVSNMLSEILLYVTLILLGAELKIINSWKVEDGNNSDN